MTGDTAQPNPAKAIQPNTEHAPQEHSDAPQEKDRKVVVSKQVFTDFAAI